MREYEHHIPRDTDNILKSYVPCQAKENKLKELFSKKKEVK